MAELTINDKWRIMYDEDPHKVIGALREDDHSNHHLPGIFCGFCYLFNPLVNPKAEFQWNNRHEMRRAYEEKVKLRDAAIADRIARAAAVGIQLDWTRASCEAADEERRARVSAAAIAMCDAAAAARAAAASPTVWYTNMKRLDKCDGVGCVGEDEDGTRCNKCGFRQCTACNMKYHAKYGLYTGFFDSVVKKRGTGCPRCIGWSDDDIREAARVAAEQS